jgi:DNA-binding ferritin-like protein (Dps family)
MLNFIKKTIRDKREYKQMMERVKLLPEDYRFTFDKIQKYMWNFASGDGYDMLKIQYDLIDLFEASATDGKHVLEITGEDVAAFCDELLRNTKTYTASWGKKLNSDILKKLSS